MRDEGKKGVDLLTGVFIGAMVWLLVSVGMQLKFYDWFSSSNWRALLGIAISLVPMVAIIIVGTYINTAPADEIVSERIIPQYCMNCEKEFEPEDKFCSRCGLALDLVANEGTRS